MTRPLVFREGAEVYGAGLHKLGAVLRYVVDPRDRTLTHLVIEQGRVHKTRHLLPLDEITDADDDHVMVKTSLDPDELEPFETDTFLGTDQQGRAGVDLTAPDPLAGPATAVAPSGDPLDPVPPAGTVEVTVRHLAPPCRTVGSHATVWSGDGRDVGRVRAVETDGDGHLRTIVLDPGWFKSERLIPADFVRDVGDDGLVLAVSEATLEGTAEA